MASVEWVQVPEWEPWPLWTRLSWWRSAYNSVTLFQIVHQQHYLSIPADLYRFSFFQFQFPLFFLLWLELVDPILIHGYKLQKKSLWIPWHDVPGPLFTRPKEFLDPVWWHLGVCYCVDTILGEPQLCGNLPLCYSIICHYDVMDLANGLLCFDSDWSSWMGVTIPPPQCCHHVLMDFSRCSPEADVVDDYMQNVVYSLGTARVWNENCINHLLLPQTMKLSTTSHRMLFFCIVCSHL